MGPMVCELDGPTPILYRSKRLVVTPTIVVLKTVAEFTSFLVSKWGTGGKVTENYKISVLSPLRLGDSSTWKLCKLFTHHSLPFPLIW
jgi:hypothetical protein